MLAILLGEQEVFQVPLQVVMVLVDQEPGVVEHKDKQVVVTEAQEKLNTDFYV